MLFLPRMVWLKRDALTVPAAGSKPERANGRRSPEGVPETGITRTADALTRIRKLVEEGRFPPGSRLPAERKLAEQLNVGRPVVREAIKVLTTLGLVESRLGSGTYVRSPQAMEPLAAGDWTATKAEFGMLDLYEVRKITEPRAAWLAATRAGERQLAEIEGARQRLEMHDRDWKLLARLDMEFHLAIFRGAQNGALEAIGEFITGRLLASQATAIHFAPALERMRSDHRSIVEAILRRQADAAEKAMIDHLSAASQDFIRGIKAVG